MIGAIIGDIAGSALEHAAVKRTDFPWFPPGSRFTDDTVLMIATADALLSAEPYDVVYRRRGRRFPVRATVARSGGGSLRRVQDRTGAGGTVPRRA